MNHIHFTALVACANEIYLYVDALSKVDKKLIEDKHLKELIKLGINYFAIVNNNIFIRK